MLLQSKYILLKYQDLFRIIANVVYMESCVFECEDFPKENQT